MTEVEPRLTRCCKDGKSRPFSTTLRAFLPRLSKKEKELPEKLESVKNVDRSEVCKKTVSIHANRVEKLNAFMLGKARAILNADTGPGKYFWNDSFLFAEPFSCFL